jgi:hypothetical protein
MAQPFGHNFPRLSWINTKTYSTHFDSRRNRSGHALEETEARVENALGALARQELKDRVDAMRGTLVKPIVPTIGEFADYDAAQGAAIDHSIATGEPLFAEPALEFAKSGNTDISISEIASELL